MPPPRMKLLFLLLLASVAHAALSPSDDPFYRPPSGWETKRPGTVLRSRSIQAARFYHIKWNITAFQLLYRSTGADEEPSHTVTTVFVPEHARPDELVVFGSYPDTPSNRCDPSYTLQYGSNMSNVLVTMSTLQVTVLLEQGWIVTVPDQEGPTHAFSVGPLEGRMLLDGARATLAYTGLGPNAKVIGCGYSGGGLSTGWAASLQPRYAPKLPVIGWWIGGMPSNVSSLVRHLDGSAAAGFNVAGLGGIANGFPAAKHALYARLTDEGRRALAFAYAHCSLEITFKYAFQNVLSEKYIRGGLQTFAEQPWNTILQRLTMGIRPEETPSAPVFYTHTVHDEIIPYGDANRTVHQWVKHGADVKFVSVTGPLMSHARVGTITLPLLVGFAKDRFAGRSIPKGLSTKEMLNPLLDPSVSVQGLGEAWSILRSFTLPTPNRRHHHYR